MDTLFLAAEWKNLVVVNYRVEPEVLQTYVPQGVELDDFNGHHIVSLVAFQFCDTKVLGMPIPWHRDFEEINLRCYVKRVLPGEIRRGVTFIKELVPRRAIAFIARTLYNENYHTRSTSHDMSFNADGGRISYSWIDDGSKSQISATVAEGLSQLAVGSVEEFTLEHYWGYTRQRDGSTKEYRVRHPQWRVWKRVEGKVSCDFAKVYGEKFRFLNSAQPSAIMVADGSSVTVSFGTRLSYD